MDLLYTAVATARGGREGEVVSDDGALDLMLAHPKELGGPGGDATNPEQLMAAGWSACFHSAVKRIAGKDKIDDSVRLAIVKATQNVAFDGVTGKVAFDQFGDTTSKILTVYKINGGDFKPEKTADFGNK